MITRRRILEWAACTTAGVLLASCSGESAPAIPSKPGLLLVTIDTLRADHLGCYGDARAQTPIIDRIAREGVLFEQAVAVAPLTLPSHASLLTGLYPPRHGIRDNADFRLPDDETTLAEHFKAQGYATAAAVGTHILAGELGLSQGFDRYSEPKRPLRASQGDATEVRYIPIAERSAAQVVDDALASLDRIKAGPFFLWVHLYDPHVPYDPPESIRARFEGRPYDGEIASVDFELGRLFDALRAPGLMDRTVVVVTADHGESLGEHGEETHGVFVYESTLRVPLVVRLPARLAPGSRYPGLVSGVDLAPTLLELMGLPPLPAVQGRSVAAALTGGEVPPRDPAYAESVYGERAYGWAPLHALRSATEKFVDAPEPEIYDLGRDPAESTNLAAGDAAALASWRTRLDAAVRSIGGPAADADDPMSEEERAALASLGYVSGGAPGLQREARPDPKRLVAVSNLFLRAQQAIGAGHADEARRLLEQALRSDPGNPAATSLLGALQFSGNDRKSGLAALRAAAAAAPGVFDNQWNLGNALFLDGNLGEAAKAYGAAIGIRPRFPEARYALGNVLAASGDPAGAVKEYQEALRLGLTTPPLRAALGTALLDTGDVTGGEAALRAAVDADPSLVDGWNKLGILLDKTGRRTEARAAFSRALETNPDHADALFNRARIALLEKDPVAARRDVDALRAAHPDYAAGRFLEAHLCLAEGNPGGARKALHAFVALPGADPRMKDAARGMLQQLGG